VNFWLQSPRAALIYLPPVDCRRARLKVKQPMECPSKPGGAIAIATPNQNPDPSLRGRLGERGRPLG